VLTSAVGIDDGDDDRRARRAETLEQSARLRVEVQDREAHLAGVELEVVDVPDDAPPLRARLTGSPGGSSRPSGS
jgi:hypothetical protein